MMVLVLAVWLLSMVIGYLVGYWVIGPIYYGFRPFVSPKEAALHPEKYRWGRRG